jgi:GAF domain-containing protein/DNA-binding response OmpR family regulator
MKRINPVIVISLILVTLLTIFILQYSGFDQFYRNRAATFETLNATVQSQFEQNIYTLVELARDFEVNAYATAIANRAQGISSAEIARRFTEQVRNQPQSLLAVRFINLEGRIMVEAVNQNNEVTLGLETRPLEQANDEAFLLATNPNRNYPATISRPLPNRFLETVIYLYQPLFQNNGDLSGILQFEIAIAPLNDSINRLNQDLLTFVPGREMYVITEDNEVILSSVLTPDLDHLASFLEAAGSEWENQGYNTLTISGQTLRPSVLSPSPWRLILVDNVLLATQVQHALSLLVILGAVGGFMLLQGIVQTRLNESLQPLETAQTLARQLANDQTRQTLVGQDDLESIITSMNQASERIRQLNEQVNEERTRRLRDIEIAARIGRETSNLFDLQQLLQRAIEMICRELGFYHAQVFLNDDVNIHAVLVASRGEAGKKLLEQKHKILIGSNSVIGQVIATGKPLIVNDTRDPNVIHSYNALLSETRAEMGLPLIVNNQTIGILDIQSRVPNAFSESDLPTYLLLADQIAIAVNTSELMTQSSKRIRQIEALNRQYTRQAWEQTEETQLRAKAYRYNLVSVDEMSEGDPAADKGSGGLALPISVRGEVIGMLSAASNEGQFFTEGDQVVLRAVADRVAMAIENARLFQETQISLAETSVLYQLQRYLNEANALKDILQAVIVTVAPDAEGGQIWLFDDYFETPEIMRIVSDLSIGERDENNADLTGLHLTIKDHPLLKRLTSNQVVLITDTLKDNRLGTGPGLPLVFRRMGARSLVIIPLNVRGEWPGLMMIEYGEPREFSEREGRIFTALIDQAGVAVDNRRLLEETEDARTRSENLYAASRIINTMQSFKDLVYSVVATNANPTLDFRLALLEGELDELGWPTQERIVAEAHGKIVEEKNIVNPIQIAADSPMRSRQAVIWRDDTPSLTKVPAPLIWMRAQGYRYMAMFPLFSANQPIAIFSVMSTSMDDLLPEDFEVYQALTGQMSTQLENRRLLQRTENALDETRRLYIASRAISSAQDSRAVYEAATEHLVRPFLQMNLFDHLISVALLLARPDYRSDAPELHCVYMWSNDAQNAWAIEVDAVFPRETFPLGALLTEANGTLHFNNLETPDNAITRLLVENHARSALIIPVQSRLQWFGALIVQTNRPRNFDEQYIRFAEAVVDQVTLAVENRQLFEDAQNEAQRAQVEAQRSFALAQAAQLANQVGIDFDQNLDQVLMQVAEAGEYTRWMVTLYNEQTKMLDVKSANAPGIPPGTMGISFNIYDKNPTVIAFRTQRTVIFNNADKFLDEYNLPFGERDMLREIFGKTISTPIQVLNTTLGALSMGRDLHGDDLNEADERLVNTLASQISIALENLRLFQRAQSEQQTLQSVLETLPAGVVVLDPRTLRPTLSNGQAKNYLGNALTQALPFTAENYHLYRTGTHLNYPNDELPVLVAQQQGFSAFQDDVAVVGEDYQVDLLVNAAPIVDAQGHISAIVATFSNISNLRSLENTLQENLRETVAIYEAQRQLSESNSLSEVLDALLVQLAMIQPTDAYIILADETTGQPRVEREMLQPLILSEAFKAVLNPEKPVNLQRSNSSRLTVEQRTLLDEFNAEAIFIVNMTARTRNLPLGWLVTVLADANFSAEQERILTQLGEVASTAIDNRYLIRSTRLALEETNALYNATTSLSRVRDLDQLINVIQTAITTLNPDFYAVFMVENLFSRRDLIRQGGEVSQLLSAALTRYNLIGRGVFLDDLTQLQLPNALERDILAAGQGQVGALAAISLRVKDANAGTLMVAYQDPHHFTDSEIRYINTLSDSISVVLDNIVLVQEIQSTLEETTILYQAGRNLFEATTPAEILNVVVDFLIQPHIDQVFIAILNDREWDSEYAVVEIMANWTQDNTINLEGVMLTRQQFPGWRFLSSPNVSTIGDVENDPTITDVERLGIQSLGTGSVVIIPLRVPNRSIGALWISSRNSHQYSVRELRIYQSFGEQASLSMEASFLLRQTERRARQLQLSAEISNNTGKLLDLNQLLPEVVDLIKSSFGYDHVQVFLMDQEDQYAVVRASTGEAGQKLLAINHKLAKGSESVIGTVTATGKPTIALDTADATVVHKPNPYLPLTRSEMALPLVIKDQVIGALDVQSNQPNFFTTDDVAALTTLAGQIAIAIENARLYQDAQAQADRMSFLFQVTTLAAASNTLEETLESVADTLYSARSAHAVIIYLKREYRDLQENKYVMLNAVTMKSAEPQPLSEIENVDLNTSDRLISEVARKQQAMILDDLSTAPNYLPVVQSTHSVILVPMTSAGELVGLMVLESERPAAYNEDDLQLLITLSGSITAIIQSAQFLERLRNANQELRELDRIKSDFLANMSHELRTPLNSIIGFSRVMLKGIDGPLTEMQEQDLTTIYNSGQHLLSLINDILDQAKIAAGKMDLKMAYFDVKPVIEGVRSIGMGLIKDKRINLLLEMAQTLPRAYGDEFRTRQVLLNLVSNASKFTTEGSVTIRVYPIQDSKTHRQYIQVDVIDTGIGIAESDIPLLFEAFRQVDSSLTRTAGGTGLGLPIARSLIEMQGGSMSVQSVVNLGSTFSITIPTEPAEVKPSEPSTVAPIEEVRPSTKPTHETRSIPRLTTKITKTNPRLMTLKRQVLLIEDSPEMVDQFRRALQREGFEVLTASIVLEAEAMASGLRPTLIVMDVNFAKGMGWDILKRLKDRDDTFDIPIIVVSLSGESERAYQLGAHTFIQRPFAPDDLTKAALAAEKESNTERILIIDDQPDAIRLLSQLLDQHGRYRIFYANNGNEGISLVARRRPDLVILDLRMPEMDGFAVLNELRSNPETSAIPVLVVTGDLGFNPEEQDQLKNIRVLQKTDISEEEFQHFLDQVQKELSGDESE